MGQILIISQKSASYKSKKLYINPSRPNPGWREKIN